MWNILAWISTSLAMLSAIYLWAQVIRYPEKMRIMNIVWVLTGLWASILGVWAYLRFGQSPQSSMKQIAKDKKTDNRELKMSGMDMKMEMPDKMEMEMNPARPLWEKAVLSSLHCGAGCTLADLIGETLGFGIFRNITGWNIGWQWGFDYLLALLIGACFQYAAIHKMSGLSPAKTFIKALKIDFLSLTAWQAGMYLFLYIVFFVSPAEIFTPNQIVFWATMQLAMLTGFILAYPVNYLLIRAGVKPSM